MLRTQFLTVPSVRNCSFDAVDVSEPALQMHLASETESAQTLFAYACRSQVFRLLFVRSACILHVARQCLMHVHLQVTYKPVLMDECHDPPWIETFWEGINHGLFLRMQLLPANLNPTAVSLP